MINTIKGKTFNESLKIINNIFKLKKEKHKNYDGEKHWIIGMFDDRKNSNQYYFDEELLRNENIPKVFNRYQVDQLIDITDIDNNCLEYLKRLPYVFEIDLIDKNDIQIDSLSFGEKQFLMQLHYILRHSFKKEYTFEHPPYEMPDDSDMAVETIANEDININNAFIFLDEFEIGLHPEWQKKTINYIVSFLKELTNIKFHIIFTSHSPFLLSDIPKQNIIFLDTEEDGNCKVVNGLNEKKQTFGANIHTLLSDSFFMDDGLMGEFAKRKIENVINFLQEQTSEIKSYKDAENIISILGEPILKMRLEKMLDDYKIKQGIETEEDIEKKIDELNQKLRKIKNGQDKPK